MRKTPSILIAFFFIAIFGIAFAWQSNVLLFAGLAGLLISRLARSDGILK